MENCISSRTRSSVSSDSINNWKICENNFKIPKRSVSKISSSVKKHKKDIISLINNEIDESKKKYETSIHELNYLQRGQIFIFYKDMQSSTEENVESTDIKIENNYENSKKYFIDDSDDSDPEYFEIDEIINRVSAERCILNRVEDLKKNNLWSLKMLSKKSDPSKPMFHWDLLIKEMKWLQGNMLNIRQNHRLEAKKIAIAASKYIKEKEAQMTKNNKEENIRARKHCLIISRMVKEWWKQMQKIVSAKQKFRIDAKRQEAINDHLGMVIETTKKYTEWLTEDLKVINSGDNDTSTDDPDFQIIDEITDDEATLIEDEIELNYDVEEEIEALKLQNKMSLEDILKELPSDYFKPMTEVNNNIYISSEDQIEGKLVSKNQDIEFEKEEKESDEEEEYCLNADVNSNMDEQNMSGDESDTINEQEKFEAKNKSSYQMEINSLMNDAEIPIEELLQLYKKMHSSSESVNNGNNIDYVDQEEEKEENEGVDKSDYHSLASSRLLESDGDKLSDNESMISSDESSVDLKTIFNVEQEEIKEEDSSQFKDQFQEITEVAMSTQPTGFTLESADVKVQVPFLLKYPLREYQHVGLDWMAAIYEKRLNGVLADEMGLGKTIQTISLLAYLSCEKGTWGPHLVIVPTSVVLNWEIEFKKWCPGFKILTYFGSFKERKEKRKGWTKTNAFHVCITSYKLAIQDCQVFKRKKWKYMILDEAQNIKNFKSQRWQTLLTFNSQRRLLLTGTPLQNNLMELWSLMHFLMPNIFQSHREFNEWFGSPLSGMIEGSSEYNEQLVMRLHKVLRPFILRRLKKDVEKQMPQKIEHLIMCPLSKRQRFLYDDYMSLTSTREMLSSGQFMNIISILMQLRKVCNHPNLFEDRPTLSPFSMNQESIEYNIPRILLIDSIYENRLTNGKPVLPVGTEGLADLALNLPKFVNERILGLVSKKNLIEEIDNIHVTDWVSKFNEKFTDPPSNSSFIPRDLIDFLKKSESGDDKSVKLPRPLIYSLKVKKVSSPTQDVLPSHIISNRKQQRCDRLGTIASRNVIRCAQLTSFGPDVTNAVNVLENGLKGMTLNILKQKTLEEFLKEHMENINRVTFVIPAVLSCGVHLNTSSRTLLNFRSKSETLYCQSNSSILVNLSQIRQNQLVQFPDTRLIEYDCGKLQVLVSLLKRLKMEGHRCLIFTQMTRMLDILEQFLSYHGYRYLRLDGTTKIEQRQIMMEQFNKDERIFVFILSTRSGGVGVNLTGADTVIFYDSDWNPTMDAQAQDRCHRIGQTRDVHIYRLISRMTIEENILKKANEKRHLNEMAIEGGQFNMSYFKTNLLQDIFQTPTGLDNQSSVDEPVDILKTYKTSRGRTIRCKGNKAIYNFKTNNNNCNSNSDSQEKDDSNKVIDPTQLEAALEAVEDENDRLAARMTMAENKADLVEFDETVPWEETEDGCNNKTEYDENKFRFEMESQLENFNAQLDPLQRYGVAWIEQSEENVLCTQLEMEDIQIENNKQTWELEQLKALHEDHEEMKNIDEDDMLYIYGEYDPAAAQREELEKLRKEEEMEQLKRQREEEENIKREKEKAMAQAWAQEQHRNALKRKSESVVHNESYNFDNTESVTRSPKQRKIIIPRMELPDEAITTAKTILTYNNNNDEDQPLHSSSSSSMVIDSISVRNRKMKNISKYSPDWENTDPNSGYQSNSSLIHSISSFSPSKTGSMIMGGKLSENTQRPFPQPKRLGRPPWKNIRPDANANGLKRKFSPTKRYGRLSHKSFQMAKDKMECNAAVQRKLSLPSQNMDCRFQNIDNMTGGTSQNIDDFNDEMSLKKKRGRPSMTDGKKRMALDEKGRNRSCSDSQTHSSAINKKNSFKIPVKTLGGEHKLFSAPLLLLKTKLVFVVTRKIEDNKGNTYTQNLTYPIECNESFNEIASKLSSFAVSNAGKN